MSGLLPDVEKMPPNVRAYLEPRLAALAAQYDGVPPGEALPAIAREAPPHVARYLLDYLAHFYDEPTRHAGTCPSCGYPGNLFRRHYRHGPGGVDYCPNCGWEEPPF